MPFTIHADRTHSRRVIIFVPGTILRAKNSRIRNKGIYLFLDFISNFTINIHTKFKWSIIWEILSMSVIHNYYPKVPHTLPFIQILLCRGNHYLLFIHSFKLVIIGFWCIFEHYYTYILSVVLSYLCKSISRLRGETMWIIIFFLIVYHGSLENKKNKV